MTRARALAPLLLALSACATAPSPPLNTPESLQLWQDRERTLAHVTHWRSEGRLALSNGGDGLNADYTWAQFGDVYNIALRGPFGAGAVTILGSPWGVAVRHSDAELLLGYDAQSLLHQHFGWTLPVDAVEHWVVGRPDPATTYEIDVDPSGRVVRLRQAEWTVEFKSYVAVGDLELPSKVFARNRNLGLRMVVDRWTIN